MCLCMNMNRGGEGRRGGISGGGLKFREEIHAEEVGRSQPCPGLEEVFVEAPQNSGGRVAKLHLLYVTYYVLLVLHVVSCVTANLVL